jgi:hypothetical protein
MQRIKLIGNEASAGETLMLFYLLAFGALVQARSDPISMSLYMHAPVSTEG